MPTFNEVAEIVGVITDAAGVAIIIAGLLFAGCAVSIFRQKNRGSLSRVTAGYRQGNPIGVGIPGRGDIIRTVAVTPTLQGVLVLGLIVLIRTFLSMALQVELEGRWLGNEQRIPLLNPVANEYLDVLLGRITPQYKSSSGSGVPRSLQFGQNLRGVPLPIQRKLMKCLLRQPGQMHSIFSFDDGASASSISGSNCSAVRLEAFCIPDP